MTPEVAGDEMKQTIASPGGRTDDKREEKKKREKGEKNEGKIHRRRAKMITGRMSESERERGAL